MCFFLWASISMGALWHIINKDTGVFDASGVWLENLPLDWSIEQFGLAPASGFQLVHVTALGCSCNRMVSNHKALFAKDADVPLTSQFDVTPSRVMDAGFMLPSVPALMVFDDGKLIYAGAYSSSAFCTMSNSFIAPILTREKVLFGPWLNGHVNTCRCLL